MNGINGQVNNTVLQFVRLETCESPPAAVYKRTVKRYTASSRHRDLKEKKKKIKSRIDFFLSTSLGNVNPIYKGL